MQRGDRAGEADIQSKAARRQGNSYKNSTRKRAADTAPHTEKIYAESEAGTYEEL
ncbi:MAG: hypothetical protein OSJ73_26350 [Lachnospiraceae bacterium]|nr:hypothetical protein [Lachnospiraceae bacterium]